MVVQAQLGSWTMVGAGTGGRVGLGVGAGVGRSVGAGLRVGADEAGTGVVTSDGCDGSGVVLVAAEGEGPSGPPAARGFPDVVGLGCGSAAVSGRLASRIGPATAPQTAADAVSRPIPAASLSRLRLGPGAARTSGWPAGHVASSGWFMASEGVVVLPEGRCWERSGERFPSAAAARRLASGSSPGRAALSVLCA